MCPCVIRQGEDIWNLVPGFSWVKLHIPVTSAGLNLYPFTVITFSYEYNSFSESSDPSRESLSLREVLRTLTHLPIRQGLFGLLRGHAITAAHYTPMTLEQLNALKCSCNPGEDGQHRMFNTRCLDLELLYTWVGNKTMGAASCGWVNNSQLLSNSIFQVGVCSFLGIGYCSDLPITWGSLDTEKKDVQKSLYGWGPYIHLWNSQNLLSSSDSWVSKRKWNPAKEGCP